MKAIEHLVVTVIGASLALWIAVTAATCVTAHIDRAVTIMEGRR